MRVSIKTLGCRLNQAESAQYEALFKAAGCQIVPYGAECELCVIKSCSVTARAESESLRIARSIKRSQPHVFIVLTGCAVESLEREKFETLDVDLIVSRADKEQLVATTLAAMQTECAEITHPVHPVFSTHRALLKIQDGCNFFCSYCIIPYNRGAPVSRTFDECLDEARAFIDAGLQEIVITGCNIACFESADKKLPDLIEAIAALPGLGRVRCGSLEPGTVEIEVAQRMAGNDKICPFLHLPLQHCDDRILRSMNRRYTSSEMRGRIEKILSLVPRVALGSDIITGFPGEDQSAFNNTKAFIEDLPFSNLHVFPYSERKGTAALKLQDSVAPALRKERAKELIALGERKRRDYTASWVGSEVEIIVEKFDKNKAARGWSAQYIPCRISGIAEKAQAGLLGKQISFTAQSVADNTTLSGSIKNQVQGSQR